jgi:multidrug efflux pump
VRFIEQGDRPPDAALKGSRQIGFTIISLTVSLVAVFIPLLLMGGVVGRLFREFAITLSASIVVSGLVSLVLTPMMCAKLLTPEEPGRHGRLFRASERAFDAMLKLYEAGLRSTLRHQPLILTLTAITFVASIWLYIVIPKGFVPDQDTGLIEGVTDAAQDISFDRMSALQKKVAGILAKDPDVISVISSVGVGTENTTINSGRFYIDIGSPDRRHASAGQIMARLGKAIAPVTGIALHLQSVQDIQIETRPTRTQYQYVLQDLNERELRYWTDKFIGALRKSPDLADATTDQQNLGRQMMITVNREAVARFGLDVTAIDQILYDAFGQRQIATIYSAIYLYHVILEVAPEFRNTIDALDSIYLTDAGARAPTPSQAATGMTADFSSAGAPVPLSEFSEMDNRLAPLVITHQNQFPAVTLSFNLPPGVSLGRALEALRSAQRAIRLPSTIETNPVGSAAEFAASLDSEPVLIIAAIIAVYIVLGVLYESYIHPITILSTLPSAGVGALLALMLCHQELNLISLIGIILLIGIVKKNGIMMVDFALSAERQEGLLPAQAIYQACLLRFRPIMMTTFAALLGALPLAVGTGTGSELRRPLGIAVVGGLLVSQFLTLYTTPVIYLMFARLERRFRRRRSDEVGKDNPLPWGDAAPADVRNLPSPGDGE